MFTLLQVLKIKGVAVNHLIKLNEILHAKLTIDSNL
jgi:hypothetical protein